MPLEWANQLTLPDLALPNLRLPDLTLPDLALADLTLPDFKLPDFKLPDLTLPNLRLPNLTLPNLRLPYLTLPALTLSNLTSPDLTLCHLTQSPAAWLGFLLTGWAHEHYVVSFWDFPNCAGFTINDGFSQIVEQVEVPVEVHDTSLSPVSSKAVVSSFTTFYG